MSYVTEDQARRSECVGPINCGRRIASDLSHPIRLCDASSCRMAWRWAPPVKIMRGEGAAADLETVEHLQAGRLINAIKRDRALNGRPLKDSKEYCERLRASLGLEERRGYCGLAGSVAP